MAFKLSGATTIDMTPEDFSRTLDGEEVRVRLLPLTPHMDRAARDRAKVRADMDGMMVVSDVDKLQCELAVEIFDAWTIENDRGQTAKITTQVVGWLMDYSPEANVMVREAVARARELYTERRESQGSGEPEGN
ncbi:MAG: hypothetical protein ACYTFZ_04555 [Planctomycetota bacterium]|jgi:hypothetical protein